MNHEIIMRITAYVIGVLILLTSCQSEDPMGNEILFGDVIGSYTGICADYAQSTAELMNREDATLSIIAASTESASIKTSCDHIMDLELPLKSASASEIIFETSTVDSISVTMTYIASADSIVITHSISGEAYKQIFTGNRN